MATACFPGVTVICCCPSPSFKTFSSNPFSSSKLKSYCHKIISLPEATSITFCFFKRVFETAIARTKFTSQIPGNSAPPLQNTSKTTSPELLPALMINSNRFSGFCVSDSQCALWTLDLLFVFQIHLPAVYLVL